MQKKTPTTLSSSTEKNPSTTPIERLPKELLLTLSAQGIDVDLVSRELAIDEFVGISSASGPADEQADIDKWVETGGIPKLE